MLRGLARHHVAHVLVRAFAASQAAENAARHALLLDVVDLAAKSGVALGSGTSRRAT